MTRNVSGWRFAALWVLALSAASFAAVASHAAEPAVATPAAGIVTPHANAVELTPAPFIAAANTPLAPDADLTPAAGASTKAPDPRIARLQILLDRAGLSPGVIDGFDGANVGKAIAAFQEKVAMPIDGRPGPAVLTALEQAASASPAFVAYEITDKDVAGPFVPAMPIDYAEKAKLQSLAYRDPAEELAERFHMDEQVLKALNPDADFTRPGTLISVADVGKRVRAPVAHMIADKTHKQLRGYGADGRLVVAYPATIGSEGRQSPTGRHLVDAIAVDAEYWYRPDVNFKQGNNDKALRLAPGPNGPVGTVWIGLTEPTYGIHGTPEPDQIDKNFSHGCVRLSNWDVEELAHLVKKGVPVEFVE